MSLRIAVAVALGQHPETGRARRCALSARALEMALRLCDTVADRKVEVVHAGERKSEALRDYLGMGPDRLAVLPVVEQHDIIPALAGWFEMRRPDVILCGAQALDGAASGEVPYRLAANLGYPIISNVVAVDALADDITVVQAHTKGRRRKLGSRLPIVLTVAPAAPAPRYPAYALSKRGRLVEVDASKPPVLFNPRYEFRPASAPTRDVLRADPNASAAERLMAIVSTASGGGSTVTGVSAEEAAKRLLEHLAELGVFSASQSPAEDERNTNDGHQAH